MCDVDVFQTPGSEGFLLSVPPPFTQPWRFQHKKVPLLRIYSMFLPCFFPPPPAESKFKQRSEVTE